MIMEIQVLPTPAGTATDTYAHVDAAIGVIAASGLPYEVGPLGTSVEGTADELWFLARAVHESTLVAGAASVVTILKVADAAQAPPTIAGLVDKHRAAP